MRKLIALFISASMLFLCACSGQSEKIEETTTPVTETTIKYSTDWRSAPLPDNFPSPPEKMHDFYFSTGKGNESGAGYRSDWVRLVFTCPESEFYLFSNKFSENGYIGGFKDIPKDATYYPVGFNGSWQDGEHLVHINKAIEKENDEITFTIDICECTDNFPEELTAIFPKFDGYSRNGGKYGYLEADGTISETYSKDSNKEKWYWDFGFRDAFVGVTLEEFEAYLQTLVEAYFAGESSAHYVDGCTVVSASLVKEVGEDVYGVFMVYNQVTKTLDIFYTNYIEFVVGIETEE